MNADAAMSASPVFSRWLEIVRADEEITVCPEDINHEAVSNLYCFSPGEEEDPEINTSAVQNFLRLVIENRKELLQKIKGPQMLFYCWHDAQCRQLRFSMVSASHDRLPFGCPLRRTDDLQEIVDATVNDWLNPEYFKNPDTEPDEKEVPFVLDVFVISFSNATSTASHVSKLVTCVHLQPIEAAIRVSGIGVVTSENWWSADLSGGCVYFACVLKRSRIECGFNLPSFVEWYEHDGHVAGHEAGFHCTQCNSLLAGGLKKYGGKSWPR
ncbi:MAG: hypothetical protein LBU11_00695 [Zoogloeaceae bacterium]|jgi:hypothetical protein|nr:hypothetical protein [Zoogloeaceae bacterium]